MSDSKPGLLKRIFSFGFGRKKEAPAEPSADPQDQIDQQSPETEALAAPQSDSEAPEPQAEAAAAEATEPVAQEPPAKAAEPAPAARPVKQPAAKKKAEKQPADKKAAPARQKSKKAEPAKPPAEAGDKKPSAPEPVNAPVKAPVKASTKPRSKAPNEAKPAPAKPAPAASDSQRSAPPAKPEPAPAPQPAIATPAKQAGGLKQPTEAPPAPPKGGKVRLFEEKSEPEPAAEPEDETRRAGWFARMRKGLSRSADALTGNIAAVFTKARLDDDTLQDLEDILIQADLGAQTAMAITDALAAERYGKDVSDEEVRTIMATEIEKVLAPVALPLELDLEHRPHVILVVGVNGSGKTTTIGKLSEKLRNAGLSTLLVAGDTFRAAAIEQLKIWGERTGAPVASRDLGSDAAGLAFDAYAQARDEGHDVMLMDTAGRLQNKAELMAELEKIIRVLKKHDETAPHTVLLTLDATTGQNALNQVEIFAKTAGVNGLVMTKLDGTARGGILVSIAARHKMPVYFIGVGEGVDDLEPFEADEFARSIAGLTGTHADEKVQ